VTKIAAIKVTVLLENSFWVGIFERTDEANFAVARKVFGAEPTDAELYEFITHHYEELNFSASQDFKLVIKRMNPKRLQREVKKEMEKAKAGTNKKESFAQETLRLELEKNKKIKKQKSKLEKENKEQEKFDLKQAKRKQKHRGH